MVFGVCHHLPRSAAFEKAPFVSGAEAHPSDFQLSCEGCQANQAQELLVISDHRADGSAQPGRSLQAMQEQRTGTKVIFQSLPLFSGSGD